MELDFVAERLHLAERLVGRPAIRHYAVHGDHRDARAEQILRELEQMAKRQYVSSTAFADIHLGLGEKQKALDWLEKSYQDQESACWYLKVDPIYDRVRNEPRFQALVQKVFGSNP